MFDGVGNPIFSTASGRRWISIALVVPEFRPLGSYRAGPCCAIGLFNGLSDKQRKRWRKFYRQGYRCRRVTVKARRP